MKANPVANIVRCCCGCFVDLYEVYFEKYSVNTYTEARLRGSAEQQMFESGSRIDILDSGRHL